jgi:hypothetical protein
MFELLLIIYLLPVLIIGMLLLKLVFWLLRIAIRLAVWLVKKAFILIWKLIVLIFFVISAYYGISSNFSRKLK